MDPCLRPDRERSRWQPRRAPRPQGSDPSGVREPEGDPVGERRDVRRRGEDRDVSHDPGRPRRHARGPQRVPDRRTAGEHGRTGHGARRPRRVDRDRPRRGRAGMTAIAVLGLGAMGGAISHQLLRAGHELSVWNRTPGRDEELVANGAGRAETPADAVRNTAVVITMVTDPPALEAVLFGSDGAAAAIPKSATLIDMSTVGPTEIASVVERLAPVQVLDAPVLGSVPSVETGKLVILVGGDRAVFDRHAELLALLGTPIYLGSSGSGALLKLVNNAA